MYYERNGESYLIFDHDMDQKTIPFEGWLHNCIFCQAITANEEDFEHDQLKVKILSCYKCQETHEKVRYYSKINNWINKNILKTRRRFSIR